MYKGIAVSPGIVVGTVFRIESVFSSPEPVPLDEPSQVPPEIARFELALKLSAEELEGVVTKVSTELGNSEAGIFRTHLGIVNDPQLAPGAREHPRPPVDGPVGAPVGLARLRGDLRADRAGLLPRADGRRPRRDLADRLAPDGPATSPAASRAGHGDESVILVAHEILPSQAMSLGDLPIAGIVTELGGGDQPRGDPGAEPRHPGGLRASTGSWTRSQSGDLMVVDGRDGMVIVRPDQEATVGLSQGPARVLQPQGPARRQPRPAGHERRRDAGRAAGQHQQPGRRPGRPEGRRHRRRPVPDRVPVPHPSRRARRGGAVRVLPPDHRRLAQPDGHDPHARPGRRQDGPLPRPPERAQPVHGLAVDPHLLREPQALRHADPRDPPRRPARQGLDALPDDHHPGRAAATSTSWSRRRGATCGARACRSARTSRRG